MPRDRVRQSFESFVADGGATVRRALGDAAPAGAALQALAAAPWAITPEALQNMVAIAGRTHEVTPEAIERFRMERHEDAPTLQLHQGIAVIRVQGPMFRHAGLFGAISGATSYESVARALGIAEQDRSIRAVLFDFDSPGGEVNGCVELARVIREVGARVPVHAYVSGLGASAAYWLASATSRISASPTAIVGSIGVLMTAIDDSALMEREGLREITIVSSQSPNKVSDPATPEGRSRVQRMVDDLAAVFVAAVAEHRGITPADVVTQFGGGDVFVGEAARSVGLVDAIESFEQAFAALQASLAPGASARPSLSVASAAEPSSPAPVAMKPTPSPDASVASGLGAPRAAVFELDQRVRVKVAKQTVVDEGAEGVVREIREGAHYAVYFEGQDATFAFVSEDEIELVEASADPAPANAPSTDPAPAGRGLAAVIAARVEAATTAERARILGIQRLLPAGALRDACIADATVSPDAAAARLLEAEHTARQHALDTLSATEQSFTAPSPATGADSPDPDAERAAHIVAAHQRRVRGRTR
jgi:signal peptide peptidase SppA